MNDHEPQTKLASGASLSKQLLKTLVIKKWRMRMYLDFVGDLDELYAACRIGYDVNAPQGMALIAEIQRQDSLIGALQVDNMRLRGLIAEAVEDMGRGGTCVHAGLKGRMVLAMTPNV